MNKVEAIQVDFGSTNFSIEKQSAGWALIPMYMILGPPVNCSTFARQSYRAG